MTTLSETQFVVATAPEVSQLIDVVADIGNANSLVVVRRGDRIVQILMPAARTLGAVFSAELFEQRGLPAGSWARLAADEHIIRVGGVERYLGRLAVENGVAIGTGRGSDLRYSDGTTLEFILASVAAALPGETEITARLVTLLPISLWSKHAEQVRQVLQKQHSTEYDGRSVRIRFAEVQVKREGEVAYGALPGQPQGRTLILDGGGRTFNLAFFWNGQFVKGVTIDNLGVEFVLDNLDKDLHYSGARALAARERTELLHALRDGREYRIIVAGQPLRIDQKARTFFDAAAAALVQELHARVQLDQVEHGFFVGGAAYPAFFGAIVAEQITSIKLVAEPETVNAYGALAQLGGPIAKKARKLR